MASGSGSRGRGSGGARGSSSRAGAAEAPSAGDAALLAPQLNPTFEDMPAADLVAHLNRYRRTNDFVDAALVLVARERSLHEADRIIREGSARIHSLLDEIRKREYSAAEAEAKILAAAVTEAALRAKIDAAAETEAALRAKIDTAAETEVALRAKIDAAAETEAALRAKIRGAAETEAALRAKIRTLQLSVATLISAISGAGAGAGLTQQRAGPSREPPVLPQEFITATTDGVGCSHGAGLTQQSAGPSREPPVLPQDFITATTDGVGCSHGAGLTQQAAGPSREPPLLPQDFNTATIDGVGCSHGAGLTPQAAGPSREPPVLPEDFNTATTDGVGCSHENDATGVEQTMIAQGEVGSGDMAMKTRYIGALWSRPAPHLVAAPPMRHGALSRAVPQLAAAPLLDAPIHGDDERAMEQVATQVLSSNEEEEAQQGDRELVSENVLRARDTACEEVVAQGEDEAASLHRRWKGKQVARATKKPRSHKRTVPLGAAALISSGISGRGLTQQAAGPSREPVPLEVTTARNDGVGGSHENDATGVQQTMIADDVPMKTRQHTGALWSRAAPHLVPAPPVRHGALSRAAPHLEAAPRPDTAVIDDYERAMEQDATDVLSSSEDAQGDREVSKDVLRARRSQGKQPARATKKARSHRHKGTLQLFGAAAQLTPSGISGRGLTQQAAGHGGEPVPQDFVMASNDGVDSEDATVIQTKFGQGEVGDDVHMPMEMSHGALSRSALHLVGAPLPAPVIDDDERAATKRVAIEFHSSNEEAHGNREGSEDVLGRVTAGEEAHGEDAAANRHKRSQGEQQAARGGGAAKKARKNKVPSFYDQVLIELRKKENQLLKKNEEERLAKEAAAAASNQLHCRCWSSAPYMPSKSSSDVEEDPDDDSQN